MGTHASDLKTAWRVATGGLWLTGGCHNYTVVTQPATSRQVERGWLTARNQPQPASHQASNTDRIRLRRAKRPSLKCAVGTGQSGLCVSTENKEFRSYVVLTKQMFTRCIYLIISYLHVIRNRTVYRWFTRADSENHGFLGHWAIAFARKPASEVCA